MLGMGNEMAASVIEVGTLKVAGVIGMEVELDALPAFVIFEMLVDVEPLQEWRWKLGELRHNLSRLPLEFL